MSGHRPFSDLTKDFAPERRRRVEENHAELCDELLLYESSAEKERVSKMNVLSIHAYRSDTVSNSQHVLKAKNRGCSIAKQ